MNVTQASIARALGISAVRVCKLRQRGMPVASVAAAAAWRRANLNPARSPRASPDTARLSGTSLFAKPRAMHEHVAAQSAKFRYNKRVGELVSAAEAQEDARRLADRLRSEMLAIADRLAPELAGLTDITEVHAVMFRAFQAALKSFCGHAS